MRRVDIFIENKRIELFRDEQIIVVSSVQNINDISSVFTDFAQTFTIPCTSVNNDIFDYFFNNDLLNTIDHRLRRNARIEIDGIPFKTGKMLIQKSDLKNGVANNYTVIFDGDLVTMKDLIKEDKLSVLDYSSLNHNYNGQEVQDRIEGIADYDICYPLISSSRVWQWEDATINDISLNTYPISYTELAPAIRISSILALIQAQYGLTFSGSWLSSDKITQSYLWFKNKELFTYYSEPVNLVFGVGNPSTNILTESTYQFRVIPLNPLIVAPYDNVLGLYHNCKINITTSSSVNYYLDIYINGIYSNSILGNGSHIFTIIGSGANIGSNKEYTFKLRSSAAITFTAVITAGFVYILNEIGVSTVNFLESETEAIGSTSTLLVTDFAKSAPDITISEFLKGLFKMFNLTAFGVSELEFKLTPLDLFYNSGLTRNITKHITSNDISIERPKIHKNIEFKYKKSKSLTNQQYFDLFGKEYGDLIANFDYDGGDYKIELPFENIMQNKFTDTNLQVGYCLGTAPEYKNYIPSPTILFRNSLSTVGSGAAFYFDNGTTTDTITNYIPFGQDFNNYSLNFGSDISTFTGEIVTNSLYQQGYDDYLNNLYNLQTRQIKVKANLPLSMLTDIALNDNIIIRDKKYLINSMQTNLVNGDVSFDLLSNWRGALNYNYSFTISDVTQNLEVFFSIPSDITITIGACLEPQFATPDITVLNDEVIVTFSCAANITNSTRTNTFQLSFTGITIPDQVIIIMQLAPENIILVENFWYTFLGDEDGNNIIME